MRLCDVQIVWVSTYSGLSVQPENREIVGIAEEVSDLKGQLNGMWSGHDLVLSRCGFGAVPMRVRV
jgi:hypothetical protein